MDSIANTDLGILPSSIKALRTADDVYGVYYEGKYCLRAVKRATSQQRENDPWVDDQTIDVEVDGGIAAYGGNGGYYTSFEPTACFASLWQSKSIWQILKPGDRIRLRWSRDGGSSENLRSVGWVGDSVSVQIIRKADVNGRRPLEFLAATYCGPDNSARFVR